MGFVRDFRTNCYSSLLRFSKREDGISYYASVAAAAAAWFIVP
jgi:hypothetical protein